MALRRAHHFAGKCLAGKFGKRKRGSSTGNRGLGINLRNVDINTQDIDGRDAKHQRAGSGIDKLPHIHAAGCDHAAERRINPLERLQFLQTLHVCLRGLYRGAGGFRLAGESIGVLLRDGVLCKQSLVAAGIGLRQTGAGFRCIQVCARLQQLLVHFRRADDGQQLALADMGADVEKPLAEVTVGACEKRRIAVGVNVGGQYELLSGGAWLGRNGNHRGSGERVRLIL